MPMLDFPFEYDRYDGSKVDDQKNVKTRRPRRSQRWHRLGIRHIPAKLAHPQTNGKLERVHGETRASCPVL